MAEAGYERVARGDEGESQLRSQTRMLSEFLDQEGAHFQMTVNVATTCPGKTINVFIARSPLNLGGIVDKITNKWAEKGVD